MTNTSIILDTYIEKNNLFQKTKHKAQKCIDTHNEIKNILGKSHMIIKNTLSKFSSDRKQLGIFILKEGYLDDNKSLGKIITDKTNIPKEKHWYYDELCVNKNGFSLLPTYGSKSFDILGETYDKSIYWLSLLQDKIILNKLKTILKKDKFDLLNKILKDIITLKYSPEYKKEQAVEVSKLERNGGTFKRSKIKGKNIVLKISNGDCICSLKEANSSTYYDKTLNLVNLDIDSAILLEQAKDEIWLCLDEHYKILIEKKKELTEYFTNLEDRLHKELIVMALQKTT